MAGIALLVSLTRVSIEHLRREVLLFLFRLKYGYFRVSCFLPKSERFLMYPDMSVTTRKTKHTRIRLVLFSSANTGRTQVK